VTTTPEVVSFDTDFGVKFGTFTCFDIYFRKPALQLTRDHQVTDFVYPTAWFSEVPFLTGKQNMAKSFLLSQDFIKTYVYTSTDINYSSYTITSRMVVC